MGALVWKAGALALGLYLCGLGLLLCAGQAGGGTLLRRLPLGSLRRTLYFALFWALMKFLLDAAPSLWELATSGMSGLHGVSEDAGRAAAGLVPTTGGAPDVQVAGLAQAGRDAGLLFLRLATLMGVGLALTGLTSPYSLGLALAWCLGWVPARLGGRNVWKCALALALMAQYLPAVHHILGQVRLAARSRGLPDAGIAYWRMAFAHIFRLLSLRPWAQAVAVVSRGLDAPERWRFSEPLHPGRCAAALGLAVLLAGAALFPLDGPWV